MWIFIYSLSNLMYDDIRLHIIKIESFACTIRHFIIKF